MAWIASLALAMTVTGAGLAKAQDGTYSPPPMFDAPAMNAQPHESAAPPPVRGHTITGARISRVPPARPAQAGTPQAAKPAVATPSSPTPARTPAPAAQTGKTVTTPAKLLPSVILEGDPALAKPAAPKAPAQAAMAPKPPAKPQIALKTPDSPARTPPAKPAQTAITAAAPAPQAPKTASPMPAARVTSKGVVTGPKTMPSVPTGTVIAENLMEPPSGGTTQETLMERHQEQQLALMVEPQAAPAADIPAELPEKPLESAGNTGLATLTIPYAPGLTQMKEPPLGALIDALEADPALRIMINAYGSPADDGENSDKRIALARALDLRKTLVAHRIAPDRIDIRALGKQSAQKPLDRVELTPYKPQKSAH